MKVSRREFIQRTGAASGALFLQLHGAHALAKAARQSGVAILCGMDKYPHLRGDGTDLCGAGSNSIGLMASALKKHGFDTIYPLINPTKAQILQALAKQAQPGKRLLFYFLGHGSRDIAGNGTLLAADACDDDAGDSYLRRDDLRQTLTEVIHKGVLVTCFVDACESWAVAYDLGAKAVRKHRCIPLGYNQFSNQFINQARLKNIQAKPRQFPTDNRGSVLRQPCFFTAADVNERAYVASIPDDETKMAGVFSYHLSRMLKETPQEEVWESVYDKTAAACTKYSREYGIPAQTPKITPAYQRIALFEGKADNVIDLEHLYELNFPDAALSLVVKPQQQEVNPASILVDETFDIEIMSRAGGYLVAVEKTPGNEYVLHFPLDGKVESAKIDAQAVTLPTNRQQVFFHNQSGPDTFKVFLYRNPAGAKKLLTMLQGLVGNPVSEQNAKDIKTRARGDGNTDVITADLVTASFRFDVRPKAGEQP